MKSFPKDSLIDFGVNLLTAKSVPPANARYVAEVAVETESMGIQQYSGPA